jgi:cellulose synthase/poly-beta-1,6-N-acetylglucosamine synthase-like glycosyltransferase
MLLLLSILEGCLALYFLYVVAYTFVFSLFGHLYTTPKEKKTDALLRFCVLIPCYKEDGLILHTAQMALTQDYPKEQYDVVIIADSLQPETIAKLREMPIQVIPVSFENSTKVKSLNKAFEQLESSYDYAVILDADNIMAPDYLSKINNLTINYSYRAIQGQRKPKNQNSTLAFLDGVSEAINNHIFRQGTVWPHLSSSISGSGVAFQFDMIKSKLKNMISVGGYDRELELILLQEGVKVFYYKEAVVYDEKVSKSHVFQNQRKRWISSQYFYLRKYFRQGMGALLKGDFVFFNSSILRNIQLPRLINIGLFSTLMVILFFLKSYLLFGYTWWLSLFLLFAFSVLISIPKEFYDRRLVKSLFRLPIIFLNMFLLLFKLKGANKKFIHTPHEIPSSEVK